MSEAKKIFKAISEYAGKHPELRVGQILHNIGLDVNSVHYTSSNKDLFYLSDDEASRLWIDFIESQHGVSKKRMDSQLCYVVKAYDYDYETGYIDFGDHVFDLYFTTQDLQDQWGDDWNDAPYEHNAGEPYYPRQGDHWIIYKLRLLIEDAILPREAYTNSPYSVEDINLVKSIPWIRCNDVNVFAGTTYEEVIRLSNKHKWVRYYE